MFCVVLYGPTVRNRSVERKVLAYLSGKGLQEQLPLFCQEAGVPYDENTALTVASHSRAVLTKTRRPEGRVREQRDGNRRASEFERHL